MWSPRAQCDRGKFIWAWREILENTPNLHIWQDKMCIRDRCGINDKGPGEREIMEAAENKALALISLIPQHKFL